jgi:hypothetical protein
LEYFEQYQVPVLIRNENIDEYLTNTSSIIKDILEKGYKTQKNQEFDGIFHELKDSDIGLGIKNHNNDTDTEEGIILENAFMDKLKEGFSTKEMKDFLINTFNEGEKKKILLIFPL